MTRLPEEFQLIIIGEIGETEWTADQIMKIVECEIDARQHAFIQSNSHAKGASAGLPTVTEMIAGDGKPKCCYCRTNHPSVSCKTVTDVTQRIAILKKAGRCFVYLKQNHMSQDCKSNGSCSSCNGQHHSRLSNNGSQSAGDNSAQPCTHNGSNIQPPVTSGHTPTTTTGLHCVNGDTPVLLQMAQACIHRPSDPACGMANRLMLDGGVKGHIPL